MAVGSLTFFLTKRACVFCDNINILFFSIAVKFRFVVFRPFVDEILTGRIRSSNHEGVQGVGCFQMKLFCLNMS